MNKKVSYDGSVCIFLNVKKIHINNNNKLNNRFVFYDVGKNKAVVFLMEGSHFYSNMLGFISVMQVSFVFAVYGIFLFMISFRFYK